MSPATSWTLAASLLLGGALGACTDDSGGNGGDKPDAGDVAADGGSAGDAAVDASRMDAASDAGLDSAADAGQDAARDAQQSADAEQMTDAQAADAQTSDAQGAAADAQQNDASVAPQLASASGRQVGRFGDDLSLSLSGEPSPRDIVAVRVELFTAQGAQLGAARIVPLATIIAGPQVTSSALLADIFAKYPELATARVALVDEIGQLSSTEMVTITRQTVLGADQACDPLLVQDRCADSDGCKGSPTTCKPNEAPVLSRVGFFVDELGPRILIEGRDVDANASGYTLRFFDAGDVPVAIDNDGDESTPAVTEYGATLTSGEDGSFFVRIEPSLVIQEEVAKVTITVSDEGDLESAPLTAVRSEAPSRPLEASCDERTFNRCPAGSACRELAAQHRCTLIDDARNSSCEAALVLNPSAGITRVRATLQTSLWEPPVGCSPSLPNQPDRAIKLVLTSSASKLVLSTDHPYTGFDTSLYLLSSCTSAAELSRCAGDQLAPASDLQAILQLTNVAAGTYYVIVDSSPPIETLAETVTDTFEVSVSIE